jgi:hypothetical protein
MTPSRCHARTGQIHCTPKQKENDMVDMTLEAVELLPARLEMGKWKPGGTINAIHIGSVNQIGVNLVLGGAYNTQINQNNISLGGGNNWVG